MSRVVQWEPEGQREARQEHSRQILAGKIESLRFVESLDLHNLQLGDDLMIEVFDSVAPLGGLIAFDLGWNALSGRAMAALGATPIAGRIERLRLTGNDLGDTGVARLCEQGFPSLRELDLAYCGVGDRGAAALAEGTLRALRVLGLRRNGIGDAGARALASSRALRAQLHALDLDYNDEITRKGAKLLRVAFGGVLAGSL